MSKLFTSQLPCSGQDREESLEFNLTPVPTESGSCPPLSGLLLFVCRFPGNDTVGEETSIGRYFARPSNLGRLRQRQHPKRAHQLNAIVNSTCIRGTAQSAHTTRPWRWPDVHWNCRCVIVSLNSDVWRENFNVASTANPLTQKNSNWETLVLCQFCSTMFCEGRSTFKMWKNQSTQKNILTLRLVFSISNVVFELPDAPKFSDTDVVAPGSFTCTCWYPYILTQRTWGVSFCYLAVHPLSTSSSPCENGKRILNKGVHEPEHWWEGVLLWIGKTKQQALAHEIVGR